MSTGAPTFIGNYQDDALYVGYTKKAVSPTIGPGGLRQDDDQGERRPFPIGSGVRSLTILARLRRPSRGFRTKSNSNLWLFFGTGRYFYRDPIILMTIAARALLRHQGSLLQHGSTPGNFLDKTVLQRESSIVDQTSSRFHSGTSDPAGK